jgi:hypothetical protein
MAPVTSRPVPLLLDSLGNSAPIKPVLVHFPLAWLNVYSIHPTVNTQNYVILHSIFQALMENLS